MSEPDVAGEIWAAVEADGVTDNLSTAERRKALDDVLRARLARVDDERLRSHAAELIRERRSKVMFAPERRHFSSTDELWRRVEQLETVVSALQRAAAERTAS